MTGDNGDDLDEIPRSSGDSNGVLDRLFRSCAADPRGSVHRAWGISLLFVVLYFALAIVESKYLSRGIRKQQEWLSLCFLS